MGMRLAGNVGLFRDRMKLKYLINRNAYVEFHFGMTTIHIAKIHLFDPCPVTSFEGRPYEIRLRCLDESYT